MTNEDKILKKLEQLEADMAPLLKLGHNMIELKDDILPLQNQAFQLMIRELQEVEAGFELDDLRGVYWVEYPASAVTTQSLIVE